MNIVDSSGGLAYFADEPNAKHFLAPLSNSDLLIVPSITIYKVFKVILRESFGQISDILITMIRKCGAPIFVTFLTEVALIVGGASCLWAKAQTKQLQTDSCDVAAADFKNRSVDTNRGRIDFKDGSYTQNDEHLGKPEWLFTLSAKSPLFTFGKDTVRIINIEADHLSGSGSWSLALGFVCSGNQVKKVLEQWSLRSPVIVQNGNTLSITIWNEYQGTAPPQGKKTKTFEWKAGTFIER